MADSAIPITGGSGYNVDTRTESTNSNHRQVIVIGDSSANGGVAAVDATNGLSVTLTTALPAGTNGIGKLTANDGVDIGDVTINNAVGAGVYIRPGTGVNLDTANVTVASSALPTGAATAAKQDTQITSLTNIETSVSLIDDAIYTDGTGTPSKAMAVAGTDGTNPQIISVTSAGLVNVADGGGSLTVDGSVSASQSGTWNITNISGTVSLPTGAATSAKQDTIITSVQLLDDAVYTSGTGTPTAGLLVLGNDGTNPRAIAVNTDGEIGIHDGGNAISIDDGGNTITVDGTVTANLGTLNGAATAAKQPALGTAGTPSSDVITVQGITSMTALKVDGSGVTQPVSGTVTANAGTGFPALITGGSAAGTTGIHILGTDGTNGQIISTNTSGHVNIADGGNSITVDGTVAISGTVTVDSELPTAASLADSTATPTAPAVGAFLMADAGSNWDKVRATTPADGISGTNGSLKTVNYNMVYDGDWDRLRGITATMDASATGILAAGLVGQFDDTTPTTVTENQFGAVRITSKRAVHAAVYTPNGDSAMDDTNDALRVNIVAGSSSGTQYTEADTDASITGTAIMWEDTSDTLRAVSASKPLPVNIVSGSSAGTEYTEDAASAADPAGPMTIAVRADSLSAVTSTDGDNIAARATNKGEIYVKHVDSIPITDNGGSLTVDGSVTVTATDLDIRDLSSATDSVTAVGNIAHDAVDSGNPLKIGGKASSSQPTSVASGDRVDAWFDVAGKLAVFDGNTTFSVDDGAGSLTVDGTVAATQSGTWNIGTLTSITNAVAVTDNSGSLTVDGSVSITGAVDTELTTADLDTGAGTDTRAVVGLVGSASGGGQLIPGSATDGLLVNLGANNDVTVTGTVSVTGVSTAANQTTIIGHLDGVEGLLTTIDADTGTIAGAVSGTEMQVDVVAALPSGTNAIGRVGHDITGIGHGVTTVTTAGTDVALASSTACKKVIVQSQTDNTGLIAVGATGVDATEATGTGIILYPGDSIEIAIDNLADIYIDSTVSGEGVRYTYFT